MTVRPGILLNGTSLLDDTVFEKAIILITEHNSKGATGFILNKPFSRRLNELEEFRHLTDHPLYIGGPVNQEHLFFMHRRPDIIEGGAAVGDTIFMGGDFKQAVAAIADYTLTEKDVKICIGYCGWDAGELEAEIEEGSWTVLNDKADYLFV